MLRKLGLTGVVYLAGLLAIGCQDYGFEELPSSVIKEKRWTQTITISSMADILFVIDNSGSMVGEQAQLGASFSTFTQVLDEKFGDEYHIAVISTGMESPGCPACDGTIDKSCMNDTGENGRFQDRIGYNQGTIDNPDYIFVTDPNCPKFLTPATKDCFFDTDRGFSLVGVNGCGYERGLAPMRVALDDLAGSYNAGFFCRNSHGFRAMGLQPNDKVLDI